MKAVMYGAGNIGRGFIGQLFAASGYEVTFIDVAEPVIDAINREGKYPVRLLSSSGHEDVWVEGVKAINGRDIQKAAEAIAGADIMATAVGVRVLPFIAPVLAEGIRNRFSKTTAPLNIIICENLIDANKLLERLIKEKLDTEGTKLFNERVGLVEASIGRMVPIQTEAMQDGNPLRVCTEHYGFLPVDKDAFKGEIPEIKNMKPFGCFDFYIHRKLFIHNMGHAICAYLGMLKSDTFIYETVKRGDILYIAQNAMMESALALSAKFKIPIEDIYFHIKDLLSRFSNKALGDTCARVGGDTVRKLGPNDRLIGAINCCNAMGISPGFISAGAGAALYCHLKEKNLPQTREAAEAALAEVSGLAKGAGEAALILNMHGLFAKGAEFSEAIRAATEAGNRKDII
ncbi:mannitol-1-phosphate 5-dehydrogenase [Leadbettera azotonutricia]|uniref:Mannitol-1-phosphate 5-dehydrogenase n=1 Tax=Leadbettera azotonutricia (strain ATCC BAA-888 / DSM 13862 / ZAS-9) TaxID=545695 RepID=F5YFM0_LEAAZ|nr:mannitol-1-phosphate 5-dehydrogenase [Leadbettera azotonutricia]AEF82784.1 mannitol-1-phosphate 5-dehydrogenase [Leadbettera azotonutricia ZAS-9]